MSWADKKVSVRFTVLTLLVAALIVVGIVTIARCQADDFDAHCKALGGHIVSGSRTTLCVDQDGRVLDVE